MIASRKLVSFGQPFFSDINVAGDGDRNDLTRTPNITWYDSTARRLG